MLNSPRYALSTRKTSNFFPSESNGQSLNQIIDINSDLLSSQLDKLSIDKPFRSIWSQSEFDKPMVPKFNIYSEKVNNPTFIPKSNLSKEIETKLGKIQIKLPNSNQKIKKLGNKRLFNHLDDSFINYGENYVSTFYKRNKNRYMFIKENTTSLKVNSVGSKSWVVIKLRLNNKLVKKKLKVDINQLPVWNPIQKKQK